MYLNFFVGHPIDYSLAMKAALHCMCVWQLIAQHVKLSLRYAHSHYATTSAITIDTSNGYIALCVDGRMVAMTSYQNGLVQWVSVTAFT